MACMATPSCSVSALLDSTTVFGLSSDYPGQVELESFKNLLETSPDIARYIVRYVEIMPLTVKASCC